MSKNKVPKTKVKKERIDLLDFAVMNVVMYMEIERDARNVLIRTKRLTQFLDLKLKIEMAFCENVLINLFGVSKAEIIRIAEGFRADKNWEKEVERFVDAVAPGGTKKVQLFNENDFKNEVINQDRTKKEEKKIKTGGGLIIS